LGKFGPYLIGPYLFGVQASGFWGLKFRVQGSGFRVQGSGYRVQGSGYRVQGSGYRVQGSGFVRPVLDRAIPAGHERQAVISNRLDLYHDSPDSGERQFESKRLKKAV